MDEKERLDTYPENRAVKTWVENDKVFSIVDTPGLIAQRYYCGYVRFPKRLVKEESYDGILTYVPVHGGITYAQEDNNGMVYGFDCAHYGDEDKPETKDIAWLEKECRKMAFAIEAAVKFEEMYLIGSEEEKAIAIDQYHDYMRKFGADFDITSNFGAMLNLLGGRL